MIWIVRYDAFGVSDEKKKPQGSQVENDSMQPPLESNY